MDVPEGNVELRRDVQALLLGAAGVPPSLVTGAAGTDAREGVRRFISLTLEPTMTFAVGELRVKLDQPDLVISFAKLAGADVMTRAKSVESLVRSGVDLPHALSIAGLA